MSFENRKYVVFNLSEISNIDFSQVFETSAETLRVNVAGTHSFVKYEGSQPSSIASLTTKSDEYTHSEIRALLATEEWTLPNQEI